MDVGSVPYHAFPTIGFAISAAQGGKASLPVSPGAYIYSQFQHVSGVPAPDGVSGVNINKLKIIDALIEQISKARGQAETLIAEQEYDEDNRINSLIEQYHTQMQAQTANGNNPYVPTAPNTGMIFSISV